MENHSAPASSIKGHLTLIVAAGAAFTMSTLFSSVKPLFITQLMVETQYSASLSGWIAAMPFVGISLAALLMPLLLYRFSYNRLVTVSGFVLVASQLMGAVYFSVASFLLFLQLLSGVGVGVLMGLTSSRIAKIKASGTIFGIVDTVCVALMSVMVPAASIAVTYHQMVGGFVFSAALCALYWGLMYRYKADSTVAHKTKSPAIPFSFSLRPFIIISMGVSFVTFSGQGFAFMFSKAAELGMDYQYAGNTICIILFVSAFACLAGGLVAQKIGCELPLFCAFIACAIGWTIAIDSISPTIFLLALLLAVISLQFSFPILLYMAGKCDAQGKWAAIAAPVITSGFAWAAILAGVLVQYYNMQILSGSTQVGMLICVLLLVLSWVLKSKNT